MSNNLQWFRLYHRIVDDEKIRLLAFEDRWHFVALCCLKADGLLDEEEGSLKWRKIAVKLGVQTRELDEIRRRLFEVGLVDENMQPLAWEALQYKSDTSTDRVRKYREKTKASNVKRCGNVSVTPPETDTESETEEEEPIGSLSETPADEPNRPLRETVSDAPAPTKPKKPKRKSYPPDFESFWSEYPTDPNMSKKEAYDAWSRLDGEDRAACAAAVPSFRAYCRANPDYRPIHACRFIAKRRFDGFAPTVAADTDRRWHTRLKWARSNAAWSTAEWGPPPGARGCRVPGHLLEPGDGNWREHAGAA